MGKALAKKSGIIKLKSKFFINRALTHFSFLLIPLWLQKASGMPTSSQSLLLLMYLMFMCSQWYLLGKEIDHRLKIYYRANSSIDRILYRLMLGQVTILIFFNLVGLLPEHIHSYFFWGTWIFLGLFYSWPTRGKIIEESVSSQLGEYRFLDSFEKTVTLLSVIMFIVTIPEVSRFQNMEALKLFFDPAEKVHHFFWNYLRFNYYPFLNYPKLYSLSWNLHFYFIGLGFYILALYGILRYFVSRRLSILGVFALLSSWSVCKILEFQLSASISTTFSILWVWSLLFCTKSSTYRSGLFVGLINYFGCLININFIFLFPVQLLLIYIFLLKERTKWYRRQTLKYSILGLVLSLAACFIHSESEIVFNGLTFAEFTNSMATHLDQKGFFGISFIGFVFILSYLFASKKIEFFNEVHFSRSKVIELLISLGCIFCLSFLVDKNLFLSFGSLWIFALLSVFPLEGIFQSISRLRSKRNVIYVIYILACLLDSHFEGRIKILANFLR